MLGYFKPRGEDAYFRGSGFFLGETSIDEDEGDHCLDYAFYFLQPTAISGGRSCVGVVPLKEVCWKERMLLNVWFRETSACCCRHTWQNSGGVLFLF